MGTGEIHVNIAPVSFHKYKALEISPTLLEIGHYFFLKSHGKLEEVRKSWKKL